MYNRNGRVAFSVLSLTSLTVALALIAPPAAAFTAVPETVGVGYGPEGMALGVGPSLVVANAGDNTLSLVDTSTTPMVVTNTIPGLNEPSAVASRPRSGEYLVANRFPPSVAVVSEFSGAILRTYPLPPTTIPAQILISPNSSTTSFVIDRTGAVIRIHEHRSVHVISLGLSGPLSTAQFSADGTHLYVASQWGELTDVDPEAMTVRRTYTVPSVNVSGLAVRGQRAYLSAGGDGVIFRVNLTTGQVRQWAVGGEPGPMSLAWYGRYLFVADRTDWALDVVKTRNGQVVNSFPLPARPLDLVLSPTWDEAFVSHALADSVTRLRIDPDPPTPPQGWVDKRCTRSSGQVTVDLRWRRPSSQGDLVLEGYRFRARLRNGSWTAWAYTVRTETNGSMSVPGYRPGERIPLQIQAVSLAGSSASLGGQCTVTR